MILITQAFAGHLGDLELASISIVNNVIVGFNFGLLLGMASALGTLCGQAFGAKKYYMLGVYMQRSCIVLLFCCVLLLPIYIYTTPVLKFLGQPDDIAELSGIVAVWVIPLHFAFTFSCPLQRFLQCQLKNQVTAFAAAVVLVVHLLVCWLFMDRLKLGVVGIMATSSISWWVNVLVLLVYTTCGGCPLTWTGFSSEAFTGLWKFLKLSASSGVMICLENWYYRILIIMTENLENARIAVDSLSICMAISGWEMMIPLAFFAGIGVQPVLSGVAVGSGWQSYVAYINLGCYYCIGLPLGFLMGWTFKFGVMGIWAGMIFGGTAVQTMILIFITMRCDWEKEAQKASARVHNFA
ncbi:unnamed protein product [Arabis nemorensis]|uniref:Protein DETOXIFICATION n=1 Tax=Arabis nemorensis TaxID=586526 RepID=A0A565CX72_9BRAS|nr:unnamed protein product [Arabis nemorensis]